jgi:pimeloyl-ACP methyl ester carboxylesterase
MIFMRLPYGSTAFPLRCCDRLGLGAGDRYPSDPSAVRGQPFTTSDAQMGNYGELTQGLQQQIADQETAYQLVDDTCRTGFWLHGQPTDRVCLLFHGFTSGPYQFAPLAERLHRAGYNVLTPLLPGHGRAGVWSAENPPPLPEDPSEYLAFGQQWVAWASQMGDRVVVGGLSGGGTLAAWLAYEQAATIDRTLLFAPYLGASLRVLDLFVKAVDTYFSWNNVKGFSYSGFEVKGTSNKRFT